MEADATTLEAEPAALVALLLADETALVTGAATELAALLILDDTEAAPEVAEA